MLSIMGHAIKQVQEFDRLKSKAPQYNPTPIAGRIKWKNTAPHAPEYNPTPIKVLKKIPTKPKAKAGIEYDPINNFRTEEPGQRLMTYNRVTLGEAGKHPVIKRQHSAESITPEVSTKKLKPSVSSQRLGTEAKFSDDEEDGGVPMDCDNKTAADAVASNVTSPEETLHNKVKSDSSTSQPENAGDRQNIFEKLCPSIASTVDTSGKPEAGITEKKDQPNDSAEKHHDGKDHEKENETCHKCHHGRSSSKEEGRHRHSSSSSRHKHSSGKSRHSSSDSKHSSHKHDKGGSKDGERHRKHSGSKYKKKESSHKDKKDHGSHKDEHSSKEHSSHHKGAHSSTDANKHKSEHSSHHKEKGEHSSHGKHKETQSSHHEHHGHKDKSDHDHHHSKQENSSRHKSSSRDKERKDNHSSTSSTKSGSHLKGSGHSQSQSQSNGHKTSGSAEKKKKKERERTKSISHSDLFGEDSESDIDMPKASTVKSSSARDPVDSTSDSDSVMLLDDIELEMLEDLARKRKGKRLQENKANHLKVETAEIIDVDDDASTSFHAKKRTAHAGAPDMIAKRKALPNCRLTPAQVMQNRMIEMQKHILKQAEVSSSGSKSPGTTLGGKPRTAHVPGTGIGKAKDSLLNRRPSGAENGEVKTTCQTASKAGKRVAHIPKQVILKRPTVVAVAGSKVPINIRQRYLTTFIDECLKIYPEKQDAFDRAVQEEKAVYERCSSRTIYLNVAVNTLKKLRDETALSAAETTEISPTKNMKNPNALSHHALLGGAKAASTSFTIRRSSGATKPLADIKGGALYIKLKEYMLTEEMLVDNGFPRPCPGKQGVADIKLRDDKKSAHHAVKSNEKLCCRCGARFQVGPNGRHVKQEECVYHWGKCWKRKVAGSIDSRYTCCQGDLSTRGCEVCKYHVHEQNKSESQSEGYVETMPSTPPPDGNSGIYSLDCEMVYTTHGVELARVTVVDTDLKPVYEKLVHPQHKVLDCNTRFSGLTLQDLKGVHTTLHDVQSELLELFSDQTILLGHSLESDLIALKLIHSTVVDTSVVFPHRLGPPYKRALRTLMGEILQKIIQNDVGGHDSQEDAAACMELMIWKVKQDAKKAARRS